MSYSNGKYGQKVRLVNDEKRDFGGTGIGETCAWSFCRKTKIYKFGIIPTATDCRSTTTGTIVIETDAGTDLGSWTFAARSTLGTGTATGKTITATTVAAGKVVRLNVTEAGSKGTYISFIDVAEQFDATVGN
jgi:hypothetical protein